MEEKNKRDYDEKIKIEAEYWGEDVNDAYNRGIYTKIDFQRPCKSDDYGSVCHNPIYSNIFDREAFKFFLENTQPRDKILVLGSGGGAHHWNLRDIIDMLKVLIYLKGVLQLVKK